jgi:CheY-like chemotaxis protein
MVAEKIEHEEVVQTRILIVDDEENFSRVLEEVLSDDSAVTTVDSAQEALDLLNQGERYNVIISDLMMPHMSGMELYAAVIKLDPDQAKRMVFMTGGAFTPAMRSFLDSIDNRIIEKPFKLKDLRQFLNTLTYK